MFITYYSIRKISTEHGTSDAIITLRQIHVGRITINRNTTATFIDLEKTFNKVD